MKKIFAIIALVLGLQVSFAQLSRYEFASLGYQYQNQSFVEVGGKLVFFHGNDDLLYRIGASALLGSVNSSFRAIPKVNADILFNFEKDVYINHPYYFIGSAEFTPKYIAPKFGISLIGIIDLTAGYPFSIDKDGVNGKELQGFNLNFSLNIPLYPFFSCPSRQ